MIDASNMNKQKSNEKYNVEVTGYYPTGYSVYTSGGICIEWIAANIGFGELNLYFDKEGTLHADTEHMCNNDNKEFLLAVIKELVKSVIIDD